MDTAKKNNARFDARLSKDQKQFFERASVLGGYRSLTDFVLETVQDKAKEIIEENEQILASEEDKIIFFDILMNPPEPNEVLISAKEAYDQLLSE
ncbi:MAG: DUF1778 domain-containing protein [Bacteroidetes bacterium]|jgi:uncharacterized protein (DUF1778 family)|nr:DUF1778 domain-containing protein [Bacteroidota bacterium]MBT5426015.1 DUF1778 domain-containing protein [Bacteroidota bacterium]MBT7462714.1 DUF1778 domain-containing protein [Bacteroidota bacterium]